MRKELFSLSLLLFLALVLVTTGCSNDDDDQQSYADIASTWQLVAYCVPQAERHVYEVPEGERDLFVFGSDRKVKVTIKKWKNRYFPLFPNEDGVYDYSYNKGKQKIQFCKKEL